MSFFGSLFGGDQAKAAKKAASIQAAGAAESRGVAEQYTGQSLSDLDSALAGALSAYDTGEAGATGALDPYAKAGTSALDAYMSAIGLGPSGSGQNVLDQLMASPDYQFRLNQGYQVLDRSRNAGGRLYSGGTLKAAQEYGQGFASSEIGNILDRLSGVATQGQSAATGQANILSQFAGSRADSLLGTAGNKANVRAGGMNAVTDAINSGAAANAGGVIGAANAKAAGVQNILNLVGGAGKLLLGSGIGGGGSNILSMLRSGSSGAGAGLNAAGYAGLA